MQKSKRTTTVALDVMGADSTPESIMSGGVEAAREMDDRLKLVLVGKEEVIKDFTDRQKDLPENIIVENADYAVAMSDAPTDLPYRSVLKCKKRDGPMLLCRPVIPEPLWPRR